MRKIIQKVLSHHSIKQKPPILIDIGASGSLPEQWKWIASESYCLAFDADTRDFRIGESATKNYKKLFVINRIVARESAPRVDFYLTNSPHCSSSLKPNSKALESYAFHALFDVKELINLPATDLSSTLKQCGFDYIDWYKTDSQGTDLRIFESLPQSILEKAIVAEFEPGIINAYFGEDKLHQVMVCMENHPFWVSSMAIKGSQRIDKEDLKTLNFLQQRRIGSFLKMAPGWCEISYINSFDKGNMGLREYLLGWVFSSIKGEHGFALNLARVGYSKFNDPLFNQLFSCSKKQFYLGYLRLFNDSFKKVCRIALAN
jgi:hypothetical protein